MHDPRRCAGGEYELCGFTVTVGVNPMVVAFVSFSHTTTFQIGTAGTAQVTPSFADAGGNAITGSGNIPNFLVPVTATSSDMHVTVSPSTLTTPGQPTSLAYDGSAAVASTVTITVAVGSTTLVAIPITLAGSHAIVEYAIGPSTGAQAEAIAAGPDGNLWFTENSGNKIGRVTTAGVFTEFAVPTAASGPGAIVAGPRWGDVVPRAARPESRPHHNGGRDHRVRDSNREQLPVRYRGRSRRQPVVHRGDPEQDRADRDERGVIAEFPLSGGQAVGGIASGSDGGLWFTEFTAHKIGRIQP